MQLDATLEASVLPEKKQEIDKLNKKRAVARYDTRKRGVDSAKNWDADRKKVWKIESMQVVLKRGTVA